MLYIDPEDALIAMHVELNVRSKRFFRRNVPDRVVRFHWVQRRDGGETCPPIVEKKGAS